MNRRILLMAAVALLFPLAGVVSAETTHWNAVADFNTNYDGSNQSGVMGAWTVAVLESDTTTYHVDDVAALLPASGAIPVGQTEPALIVRKLTGYPDPGAVRNVKGYDLWYDNGNTLMKADALSMHPGYGSRVGWSSVLEFTAPTSGEYLVTAHAFSSFMQTTSIIASILVGRDFDNPIAQDYPTGYVYDAGHTQLDFDKAIALSAGNTMQFISSPNGGACQQSGWQVDIWKVPEPSTLVLLATGMMGLLCYGWRKRK
jgi:hypothetical protein